MSNYKELLKEMELSPEKLKWNCPMDYFKFESTAEVEPLSQIVGQTRAIEAIRLGAQLNSKGYNIFVSGLSGTGRFTTVKAILEEVTIKEPILYDYCYVYNFENPDLPKLLKLKAGDGKLLAKSVNDVISFLKLRIPKLFEDEIFQMQRNKLIEEYQNKEKDIIVQFDNKIKPFGFIRGQLENEQGLGTPEIFPLVENKPVHIDSLFEYENTGKITTERADQFRANYQEFKKELYDIARKGMKIMQEFKKAVMEFDKSAVLNLVSASIDDLNEKFAYPAVKEYLEQMKKFTLDNFSIFLPTDNQQPVNEEDSPAQKFLPFQVNIILDNSNNSSAPIIIETTPSYTNLFGTIEKTFDSRGYWRTDFTKVKAGSLLKADQGYLIVNAQDLYQEPGVWQALKRVLLYDKLEIQTYESYFQLSQLHLKPEAIDVNVKIIIIGGQSLYRYLYLYEKGFKKIFKVNAQFDYETERTEEIIEYYTKFIAKLCTDEELPHCTADGVAAIIEWALKHSGSQKKISLKFSDVADVVREAAFYDKFSNKNLINREDVEKAIQMRNMRNDMMDEKLRNYILEGSVLIDTQGEKIGVINGLTVLDTGIYSFGKPARITATVSAGNAGIVNIEREVNMSGAIHNKGIMILSGYIREIFAQEQPLSLTASIAFEQSYSGIDGDSATAAEIFVLMSALSGLPVKQNLAVTGSVNQKGEVQPIGGVNQKIRGFYEICKERGFTGDQGILIPHQNIDDLMLDEDIINDCKKGNFHIYNFSKIEQGVELFMSMPAGERGKNNKFPKNSVFGLVDMRLEALRTNVHKAQTPIEKKSKLSKKGKNAK
jgi:lon-related putative ATP-dependent protease